MRYTVCKLERAEIFPKGKGTIMKKIISIVLAALMLVGCVVAFASCKKEEEVLVMATNAAFPPY